ncbi:MAG: phage major capsid protein [Anaerolineae bacterium]|nr:phage major capsid protein [Anaerolineae bacterium]
MDLKERLKKALLDARAICVKAEEEKRDFTAEEREQVQKLLAEARGLKEKIEAAEGDAKLLQAVLDLGAGIEMTQGKGDGGPAGRPGRGKSIGEQFVSSPEFQAWMKQVAPGGNLPSSARGLISPPVEFKGLFGRKEVITGEADTSAGAFVQTDYTGIYEPIGRYPLVLRDLITVRTTTSDLVHFVRQTCQVTQAAVVHEANVTTPSGATGEESGEKPEGTTRWEPVTEPVKTVAVWIPSTKRALNDVAQLRSLIDSELNDDVNEELESQMLTGNGVGENFTGVLNTAGILIQAWDTDLLTTIRRARTALRVTGRARATALVCHPNDAETLDLLQDTNGQYYFGGPIDGGAQRVWRVPVVESDLMTEGTGIMGDWRKAVLWDRERATIQISDSHEDFFIRNMVAILCELRAAFALTRPSSFIEVPFESGS